MEEGKLQAMPNIEIVKLKDGIERYYIDTYKKLYLIVNERFKMQKEFNPEAEPIIDLSCLIIFIKEELNLSSFWIGKLCGEIDGIINLGDGSVFLSDVRDYTFVTNEIKFQVKYEIDFAFSILYEVDFAHTTFINNVRFYNTQLVSYAYFNNSVFNKGVTFRSLKCKETLNDVNEIPLNIADQKLFLDCIAENKSKIYIINFSDSIFDDDVCFNCIEYLTEENNICYFKSEFNLLSDIYLDGSHFNKKLKINNVAIGEISLQNCHFDDTVNISLNKYEALSNIDFSFSTINSLFFIDSDLGDRKGEPIKLSKEISFSKSLITKDAFIFLRNINYGDSCSRAGVVNFEYANVLGIITIQNSKLDKIKLNKSTIIGAISIENVETDYDYRESIAKVKDSYLKRNDIINYLTYRTKEMEFYSEGASTELCHRILVL